VPSTTPRTLNGDAIQILIIDDDRNLARSIQESLERVGYACTVATSGSEGARLLDRDEWDVVLTDLKMPDLDGLSILRKARESVPDAQVVMITGFGDVKTAVEALKQGAADYLTKPVDIAELRAVVEKASEHARLVRANRDLKRQLDERFGFEGVVGNSAVMQQVIKRVQQAAASDANVLLLGETGTGKDLIAKAIHNNSRRKNKRLATLNCAAPNENLIEDELFGHDPGAYTGGERQRKGIFEYADGGTVFLDEIGDMPFKLQAKLLRVLENREVTRIGSNQPIKVDIRLISATHRDLDRAMREGNFREDLYHRLKVVTIRLPALRERREDIPLLAAHFMKEFNARHGKNATTIAEPVRRAMAIYPWPGNVRELANFVESMIVFDVDGVLGVDDVPEDSEVMGKAHAAPAAAGPGAPSLVGRPLAEVERYLIEEALKLTGGNREEASRMLGIGERTLYRKIQDWKQQDRIRTTLDEHGGDVGAAAKALQMDEAELAKEIKKSG
jgi:two-component system response regulator HydG